MKYAMGDFLFPIYWLLTSIIIRTMFGNSIATHLQYRHFMVNHFTNLICLDGNVVVDADDEGDAVPLRMNNTIK